MFVLWNGLHSEITSAFALRFEQHLAMASKKEKKAKTLSGSLSKRNI